MHPAPRILSLLGALLAGTAALAGQAETRVRALVEAADPPGGVVFEIASGDADALAGALPRVQALARTLRQRFPGLDIAVVTHGAEQFALLADARDAHAGVHATVQSLTSEQDIPVHVCGTHAGWRDKTPEDFPDYVVVSPAGPAQVNDYRALGFQVIRLR